MVSVWGVIAVIIGFIIDFSRKYSLVILGEMRLR